MCGRRQRRTRARRITGTRRPKRPGGSFRPARPPSGDLAGRFHHSRPRRAARPFHSIFNFYYTHDTHFSRDRTRTSLGPRAPPLASSFDLFSRRPHQQPQIPTCGLDCTFSKRSVWRYTHPTRSSLYILSRAEREALPTPRGIPRGKAERTRSRLAACSAWRFCPQLDTFDRSWAVDTTPRRSR